MMFRVARWGSDVVDDFSCCTRKARRLWAEVYGEPDNADWTTWSNDKLQALGTLVYEAWRSHDWAGGVFPEGPDEATCKVQLDKVNDVLTTQNLPTDVSGYDLFVDDDDPRPVLPPIEARPPSVRSSLWDMYFNKDRR